MSVRKYKLAELRWYAAGFGVVVRSLAQRLESAERDEDELRLLWRLGVNHYRAGDCNAAVRLLEQLLSLLRERVDRKGRHVERPLTVYDVTLRPSIHQTVGRAAVCLFLQDKCPSHLELAHAHYGQAASSLVVGLDTMLALPRLLNEFGLALELYGAFESAMDVYARVLVNFPTFRGYFDALYRSTVVGCHLAVLGGDAQQLQQIVAKCKDVLRFLLEALPANINDIHILFFFGRVLGLSSIPQDRFRALSAFESLFALCEKRRRFEAHTQDRRAWLENPHTWFAVGNALEADGELLLATQAYNKFLVEIRRRSAGELSVSVCLTLAKHFASYQNYAEALRFADEGLRRDRFCRELRELVVRWSPDRERELRRDEDALRTIMQAWKGRCWSRGFVQKLRTQTVGHMQQRLGENALDVEARTQLAYYARDRFRSLFLFEEVCATRIQRAYRLHRKMWIWREGQRRHHAVHFTDLFHRFQRAPYRAALREEVIAATQHKFLPRKHPLLLAARRVLQENAALCVIVRGLKSYQWRARLWEKIEKRRAAQLMRLSQCAVRIQVHARRLFAKKKVAILVLEKLRLNALARRIQRLWRRFYMSPRQVEKREMRKALRNRGKAMFIMRKRLLPLVRRYRARKKRFAQTKARVDDSAARIENSTDKHKAIKAAITIQRFYRHFICNIWRKVARIAMAQYRDISLSFLLRKESSASSVLELPLKESFRYRNPGIDTRSAAFKRLLGQRCVLLTVHAQAGPDSNLLTLTDLHIFARLLRNSLCRIERLVLFDCDLPTGRAIQEALRTLWAAAAKCVSLHSLWIVGGWWASEHLFDAAKLVQIDNPRIQKFAIEKPLAAHAVFDSIGSACRNLLMDFFNYSLPGLHTLSLHNCSMRDEQMTMLASAIEVNTGLRNLHVSLNWITDIGFVTILEAVKGNTKSNVEYLNFSGNLINLGQQAKQSLLEYRSKPHQKVLLTILLASNRILRKLEPVDFVSSQRVFPQLVIRYSDRDDVELRRKERSKTNVLTKKIDDQIHSKA